MLQKLKNVYHLLESLLANIKYSFPAKKLTIIGVTGTDGKTTTTSMIYHILKENGFETAMITTIFAKIGDNTIDTGLHVTTPEPGDLPKILTEAVKAGMKYVVLESTSSGLDQNRVFGITYDASLITNIGHDHIDYHKTWENYANAKFKLVKKTKELVVLNKDHESAQWLENKMKLMHLEGRQVKWFSKSEIQNYEHTAKGITFEFEKQNFKIPIIGEYNVDNALAAIKICQKYLDLAKIAKALETFESPIGRMQVMTTSPFTTIVDFAHTPTALNEALNSINKVKSSENARIICLFGCAGQRDIERRKMGAVSVQKADITLVSLEDPRTEKVEDINNMILEHAVSAGGKIVYRFKTHADYLENFSKYLTDLPKKPVFAFDYDSVDNRVDAIHFAIKLAKKCDIIDITGKGHEQSLAIGNPIVENPHTDQEAVLNFLQ